MTTSELKLTPGLRNAEPDTASLVERIKRPVYDAISAGAVGDGVTLNTRVIQTIIDDCSDAGGGVVRFAAGRYLTGTIQVRSGVSLRLEAGATLLGSPNVKDYDNVDPFIDGSGNPMGHALIVGIDAQNVGIEGPGTIDGQNPRLHAAQDPYLVRPFLVRWIHCRHVTMREVTLTGPGAWTLNFFRTEHALIQDITIRSRGYDTHNNDGINIDSSRHFQIRNCDIISGDDALVIKSTSRDHPSYDIVASDCRLSSRANAIKIGTESIGGFERIHISRCHVLDTHMAGIAIYAVDGGDVRDVVISDVRVDDSGVPISIRLGRRLKVFRSGEAPRDHAGTMRGVTIRNITTKYIGMIGALINGLSDRPIRELTLQDIHLHCSGGGTALEASAQLPECETDYPEYDTFGKTMPAYGIYIRHVDGLALRDVQMDTRKADARPDKVLIDVRQDDHSQNDQ